MSFFPGLDDQINDIEAEYLGKIRYIGIDRVMITLFFPTKISPLAHFPITALKNLTVIVGDDISIDILSDKKLRVRKIIDAEATIL